MRIAITGGAGFIGSNLADRLLEKGHDVFVIDNLATGRKDNIDKRVNFTEADIADPEGCKAFFDAAKPDIVVHAAASYKDATDWENDMRVNAIGTINVVRGALQHKVKRLIYFQTALCYGHHPLEQPITLGHPIRPDNSYAVSKTAGEQIIMMSKLDYVSLRLANCYGPRNLSGPIPTFFKKLTTRQKCFISDARRDFVYIDDLLDIVEMAINGVGASGIYHVASGTDFAIQEIFEIVCDLLVEHGQVVLDTLQQGQYFGRFWDDVKTILLDPSKTQQVFGKLPTTPLRSGIMRAIKWYEVHEIVETYTHLKDIQLKC
jgi:UDP-glucose 4-epimerase